MSVDVKLIDRMYKNHSPFMLNFKIKAFEYDIQNSINADEIEHKIEVVKILKFILEDKYARKV